MKTADLIPFILLELKECDKYGFELIKNIETKSNGKIIIKQPTLYTILKKLEKTKFISSYWEDSEIGGKRHYYKLTENGKKQADTLPSTEILLQHIFGEADVFAVTAESEDANYQEQSFSIFDQISPAEEIVNEPEVKESVLPTSEVFSNYNLDSSTELEINTSNLDVLKADTITHQEQFANNNNVSKFTETQNYEIPKEYINNLTTSKDNIIQMDLDTPVSNPLEIREIKYVEYIDPKLNPKLINAKRNAKHMLLRVMSTCACIICLLALCSIVTKFTGTSALYYTFFIALVSILVFYPTIFIANFKQYKIKVQENEPKAETKKYLFGCIALELLIILLCVVVNISMGNNSIADIFNFKNFANMYAPVIMGLAIFADMIFAHIFMNRNKKNIGD